MRGREPSSPYEKRIRQFEVETSETVGKAHGRIEHRRIDLASVIVGYTDWPGARQFAKITRRRTGHGKTSRETELPVTSPARG
ncbi:MAG: hypothetical protein ACYS9X_09650 [Planctomycetota bacterium]|jgi:hypothetical protein